MRNMIKVFLLPLILLTPILAYGDSIAPPRSYAKSSSNNKFIFVMIAPIKAEYDGHGYNDEYKQKAQKIRAKYAKSGMYLNDGSIIPLWIVDWYSYSVLVPSDGVHLIRKGPWASDSSDEAFTLFANGKIIRSYKISHLVASIDSLPHSVSHFMWEKSMSIDDEKKTLSVITLNNEQYLFDYRTGSRLLKTTAKSLKNDPFWDNFIK